MWLGVGSAVVLLATVTNTAVSASVLMSVGHVLTSVGYISEAKPWSKAAGIFMPIMRDQIAMPLATLEETLVPHSSKHTDCFFSVFTGLVGVP